MGRRAKRGSTKAYRTRIGRERAIPQPCRKIKGLDSVFDSAPTRGTLLGSDAQGEPFRRTEVHGEDRKRVAALRQFSREDTDLQGKASSGTIWKVGLTYVEDSYCRTKSDRELPHITKTQPFLQTSA
jgi:hypothetical protein